MKVRKAQKEDLEDIRLLAIRTYVDTFGQHNSEENMNAFLTSTYSENSFMKEFREENSSLWVVEELGKIAGFMRLRETNEVEDILGKETVELQRLYIDAPMRGKNAGSILMRQAINLAQKAKKKWIWLGVWERNYKAQSFYKKWGFEKFSEHIFLMGDDPQIDWLFRRAII